MSSDEFFDEYKRGFLQKYESCNRKLSELNSLNAPYLEKKKILQHLDGDLEEVNNFIKKMQFSGTLQGTRKHAMKRCKDDYKALKKRKKKADEDLKLQILVDKSLDTDEKERLGNDIAAKGVGILQDGLQILDQALGEADETQMALEAQGSLLGGQGAKVGEMDDGLKMAKLYVQVMQNRDFRVRCYVIGMWVLMLIAIGAFAIHKQTKKDDSNGSN